ncbi:inositol monophosphatase family protein [Pontiellaceae bacterium B12219]|nr:inositol monophosphatase family protein [Pontiellaceae bacterium B12219]
MNLKHLAEVAIEAAVSTGKYIVETRPLKVEHKGNGGSLATEVVTEVDRASQEKILQCLEPTFAEFDLGLLTEESPDDGSRLTKDYFWCIDPIDGTLPFIEGLPGYAVSIALISREGIPFIGVVYDPVTETLYHAIRDGGAFRNSKPWKPDFSDTESKLTIFTDRSEGDNPQFQAAANALGADWGTYGGGVMNAIWCLEHAPACYFKFPKAGTGGGCFWDFAATACIFHELGAWATDISGKPFDLNREDTVYLSHCGVLFSTHPEIAERFLKLKEERA